MGARWVNRRSCIRSIELGLDYSNEIDSWNGSWNYLLTFRGFDCKHEQTLPFLHLLNARGPILLQLYFPQFWAHRYVYLSSGCFQQLFEGRQSPGMRNISALPCKGSTLWAKQFTQLWWSVADFHHTKKLERYREGNVTLVKWWYNKFLALVGACCGSSYLHLHHHIEMV